MARPKRPGKKEIHILPGIVMFPAAAFAFYMFPKLGEGIEGLQIHDLLWTFTLIAAGFLGLGIFFRLIMPQRMLYLLPFWAVAGLEAALGLHAFLATLFWVKHPEVDVAEPATVAITLTVLVIEGMRRLCSTVTSSS